MDAQGVAYVTAGIGAAAVTFAAAFGISKLARAGIQGIARQPEAAGDIRGAIIITAAMIEGVALLSAAICFLLAIK
ncbi:F0F1 ATP synthase subunit C [candidate division KSB1 bacterium]|nr:F0F1 ATP synthase subunit C [candidate division KSB1 bacterium]